MLKNTAERYGLLTKLLHWIIAFSILGLIWLGWWMVDLSYYDPWYHKSLSLHRVLGLAVLGLAIVMLLWQRVSRPPALPASIPRAQRIAAHAVHHLLFLMMLLLPVTGYLISTSAGQGIPVYDLFEVPALLRVDEETRDLVIAIHYYCAYGTGLLAAVHAAAALKHQFIDRDGILARMIWR
ncbi:MAG TPA: cytochrome b [Gammaproteobacteria bacterium]|nr:cytochrome b [Gammaproteobacteria bacterium]